MRSEEVVISDEESGQHSSAVDIFEAASSPSVELVSSIEPFDELFQVSVFFSFIVIIAESNDLSSQERFVIRSCIKGKNCGIV